MSIPNTHSKELLDWEFNGGSAPSLPGSYWLGLLTTAPGIDGTGFVEVSGGSYARKQITWLGALDGDAGAELRNDGDIDFVTSTGVWGDVVALGVFTASTAGSLRRFQALPETVHVGNNEQFLVPDQSLRIRNRNTV